MLVVMIAFLPDFFLSSSWYMHRIYEVDTPEYTQKYLAPHVNHHSMKTHLRIATFVYEVSAVSGMKTFVRSTECDTAASCCMLSPLP